MNIVSKGLNFYFYRPTQFLKHSVKSIWHKLASLERGPNKIGDRLFFCVSEFSRFEFMENLFLKIGRQGIVLCRLALSDNSKVFAKEITFLTKGIYFSEVKATAFGAMM
jgi:hypothetical protein